MIVDDEPINVKILQKHLKLAGYSRFITTSDAMSVLDCIRKNPPDVLLLDVMMPDVNGLDLLRQIPWPTPSLGYFPILILTASDSDETRLRALELGATDFLGKPVNASELVARVRNALLVKAHHDHLKSYSQGAGKPGPPPHGRTGRLAPGTHPLPGPRGRISRQ